MIKTIMVTGGAGFIGSAVIRYIINETSYSVVNLDKLTYAGNLESLVSINNSERYSFEQIDICSKKEVLDCLNKHKPDLIMHLAAESHVDKSISGPDDFILTNIIGTFTLLEQTRIYWENLNDKKRESFKFHHISTDEVYGDLEKSNEKFKENTPYNPSSPYSSSKASSDHLVRAWGRTFGLPVVVTNCSNNYGPYQFPEKLIPLVIINALSGKPIPVYGSGKQIRDWLYVEDHAKALLKVALEGRVGETYNIGGNNEKTNMYVIKSICSILNELEPCRFENINKYEELIEFVSDRQGGDFRYAIDASKIHNELNWKPNETFKTGLQKTIEWYISNDIWWKNILNGSYKKI